MFKKILLPVDGSQRSLAAIDTAVAMAKAFDAELRVLLVVDPLMLTAFGPDLAQGRARCHDAHHQKADDAITTACQMIHARGMEAQATMYAAHLVWVGILEFAQSWYADLVVMGSHGHHGLQRCVLGGVTHQALLHARIPVLVVRDTTQPLPPSKRTSDLWRSARVASERIAQIHRRR